MIPPKRKREKNKKYRNDPSIHPLREGCIVVEVVDCDRKFRSAIGTRVFSFRRVDHPQHSLTIYRPLGQTFPISGNESRTHRGARRLLVNRAGRRVSCGGIAGNEGRRHFIASTSSFFLFFFPPPPFFFYFAYSAKQRPPSSPPVSIIHRPLYQNLRPSPPVLDRNRPR